MFRRLQAIRSVLVAAFAILFTPAAIRAQTTSTFDILAATESLTVVGTSTFNGNGLSVGVSTLVVSQGRVGIGTTTPSALFAIVGPLLGNSEGKFQWLASSAALRSGETLGSEWAPSNIGVDSVAFGYRVNNQGPYSTIAGGYNNLIQSLSSRSFIGSGEANVIYSGDYAVLAGGQENSISNLAGSIGGGHNHSVSGRGGTVSGGGFNTAGAGSYATVGGGYDNVASGDFSTVAGGGGTGFIGNVAEGVGSFVGGGSENYAIGDYSTVPGGYYNFTWGAYSFVGGHSTTVSGRGSFVWADSQTQTLISNTTDEFRIRAGGGFVLLSSPTLSTIIVSSGSILISTSASVGGAVPNLAISSITGGIGIGTLNPATKLHVSSGVLTVDGVGAAAVISGSVSATSATLSASGSNIFTLTTSSGIHILAGGIEWADGSVSTSAAGGSNSGSASTSANNTWTGTNSFGSSVTFNGGIFGGASVPWVEQSGSVTAATSLTVSNLAANTDYELDLLGVSQTTSGSGCSGGALRFYFNSDTTAGHYAWSTSVMNSNGGGLASTGSSSDSKCQLHYETGGNDTMAVGAGGSYVIRFNTYGGTSTTQGFMHESTHYDSCNSRWSRAYGGCSFLTSNTITSITVNTNGVGGFTATWKLRKLSY